MKDLLARKNKLNPYDVDDFLDISVIPRGYFKALAGNIRLTNRAIS